MTVKLTSQSRQYSDWNEDVRARNSTQWKIIGLLFGVISVQFAGIGWLYAALMERPVRFIRIGPDGHAEEKNLESMTYSPQVEEAKYYLRQWARSYYGRVHHKFAETHALAARFFHKDIADARMRLVHEDADKFARDETANETEISSRVVIRDFVNTPYEAELQVEKTVWTAQKTIVSRENWTVTVHFVMTGIAPYGVSQYNPVGLLITSIEEDRLK